jgi:putative flippase GtrA
MRTALRRMLTRPSVRFLISGGLVASVSLSLTTALHLGGVPFQIAFIAGYSVGILVHFLLHRSFTFASDDGFALGAPAQARRFVLTVLVQYALIAGGVAVLAPALGLPELAIYFGLIVLIATGNFLVVRHRIFHPAAPLSR